MKLFTKQIDKQLFAQYAKGNDLANQKVIAKIFNPYSKGVWYIINSDPNDPDYLWAIVDLIDVEVGSVSREELETLKVPPFRLGLERDMSFTPINALEVYNGARSGNRYKHGGSLEDENKQMLLNQAKGFEHHAGELRSAVKKADHVPAWVVAKSQRATTDLSDITHYLDGENEGSEEMASGGYMAKGGGISSGTTYVPNRNIKELSLVVSGNLKSLEGSDIVDGVYVKNKTLQKLKKSIGKKTDTTNSVPVEKDKYEVKVNQYVPYGSSLGVNYYYVVDSKGNTINKNTGKVYKGKQMDFYKFSSKTEAEKYADKLNDEKIGGNTTNNSIKTSKSWWENAPKQVVKDSVEYYSSRKKLWNEKKINLSKKDISELVQVQKIINELYPEFNYKFHSSEKSSDVTIGEFKDAKYAKGKIAYHPPKSDNGFKNREMRLAEAKGVSGKWSHREKAYIMSKGQAEKLKTYLKQGKDASSITGEVFASGGKVTFEEKVSAVKSSLLKRKKVSPKVQKDYGKTYSPKEAEASAKRIVGAMTAKERLAAKLKKGKK